MVHMAGHATREAYLGKDDTPSVLVPCFAGVGVSQTGGTFVQIVVGGWQSHVVISGSMTEQAQAGLSCLT